MSHLHEPIEDYPGLEQDGDFHTPLERVRFEAGMLLGVDATRAEQSYHRQRLNRHNYWFHGAGTLLGLAVSLEPSEVPLAEADDDVLVRMVISPGVGIDRLGREVMSHEPYCVNLGAWFQAQLASPEGNLLLQDGLVATGDALSLLVTMRYQSCDTGLQPVMARKVNAGTDPVKASRARDSILLEIIPGPMPDSEDFWPWSGHRARAVSSADDYTQAERDYLDTLPTAQRARANLQAQLVYAMPNNNEALEIDHPLEGLARTLLAHVHVPLRVAALPALSPVVNPRQIAVNNFVRPFISTADQLAWLRNQE